MVDGVLRVVDAFHGPMPQPRFVLGKALALGRTPIIVINKIDRPGADPMRVHDEVLSLFIELEADETQLEAPVVYASAKEGVATMDMDTPPTDLSPLFDTIVSTVPQPPRDAAPPAQGGRPRLGRGHAAHGPVAAVRHDREHRAAAAERRGRPVPDAHEHHRL